VVGYDHDRARLARARRLGAVGRIKASLEEAVAEADCVILATPVDQTVALMPAAFGAAVRARLILDVGGIKGPIAKAATHLLRKHPQAPFVGGHPLAGRERGGPDSASPHLFVDKPFALVPLGRASKALHLAQTLVRSIGGRPLVTTAREHDRIVAATSALPQIAAIATALAVAEGLAGKRTLLRGPGYEGMTRLAASPFGPWKSPLFENARNVNRALAVFEMRVRELRKAIEKRASARLGRLFRKAAAARRALTDD